MFHAFTCEEGMYERRRAASSGEDDNYNLFFLPQASIRSVTSFQHVLFLQARRSSFLLRQKPAI